MNFSIIPGRRISRRFQPELKIYAPRGGQIEWTVSQDGVLKHWQAFQIPAGGDYTRLHLEFPPGLNGSCTFSFAASDEEGQFTREYPYEVLDGSTPSTTLLDGCWVSLIHWSDAEALHFNPALRTMTGERWEEVVEDMHTLGIYGIVLQNMFDNDEYVFAHSQGQDAYRGKAFYPSALYPARYEGLACDDPLEHILSKADELHMQVFIGVGLYAWFDFSPDSLLWHKKVAAELWERYGHHPSFYSFYLSEELHGSFYEEWPEYEHEWINVAEFCAEFASFIKELAPTKPISLAPNNIRFELHREKWLAALPNIDILLPFAFARDLEHLNVKEIKDICDEAGTHFWVDLEIFKHPFDETGLIPKSGEDLIKEIRIYDEVENIYGYQYIGLLNNPDRKFRLGRQDTVDLFLQYQVYLQQVKKNRG